MSKQKPFRLNNLCADILRLCATNEQGRREGTIGVAPMFHRRFNLASSGALMTLVSVGYVTFDAYNFAVATPAGESALADWDAQEGSQA